MLAFLRGMIKWASSSSEEKKMGIGSSWRGDAHPTFSLSCLQQQMTFPDHECPYFQLWQKIIYFLRRAANLLATAVVAVILFFKSRKVFAQKNSWGYKFLLLSAGVTSVIPLLSFKYSPKNVGFWLTRKESAHLSVSPRENFTTFYGYTCKLASNFCHYRWQDCTE